jgi:hypothetical protein
LNVIDDLPAALQVAVKNILFLDRPAGPTFSSGRLRFVEDGRFPLITTVSASVGSRIGPSPDIRRWLADHPAARDAIPDCVSGTHLLAVLVIEVGSDRLIPEAAQRVWTRVTEFDALGCLPLTFSSVRSILFYCYLPLAYGSGHRSGYTLPPWLGLGLGALSWI